jgi:hypothetical protein
MVCLFQNWEGDEASKSRIRRFRYSTVVALARDIGIRHARHLPYQSLQPSTFSWVAFVAREQLIRVIIWVFLLDTAFVIFNNVPPRMSIKEMKLHLACSEACFQAPTGELCFQHIQSDPVHQIHLLSSATAMMCKGPIGTEIQLVLADAGPLNMFALTSGWRHQRIKMFIQRADDSQPYIQLYFRRNNCSGLRQNLNLCASHWTIGTPSGKSIELPTQRL